MAAERSAEQPLQSACYSEFCLLSVLDGGVQHDGILATELLWSTLHRSTTRLVLHERLATNSPAVS